MSRSRIQKLTCIAVVVVGLCALYLSDEIMVRKPREKAAHYADKYRRLLKERHQLLALWTFDSCEVAEEISRSPCTVFGAKLVEGRAGRARRFDGQSSTFIETPFLWDALGTNYTMSAWVRIRPDREDQAIVYNQFGGWKGGFILRSGRMNVLVPLRGDAQYVDYEFTRYGEFVHIAAVVDGDAGTLHLYEDGTLKGTTLLKRVDSVPGPISFGRLRQDQVVLPFSGTLDDVSFWGRALTAEEVKALSTARSAEDWTDEGGYRRKQRFSAGIWKQCRNVLKSVDLFNPFRHQSQLLKEDLPQYAFFLSKGDQRFFNRLKHVSAHEGVTLTGNTQHRRVQMGTEDIVRNVTLRLHAPDACSRQNIRSTFAVTWTNTDAEVINKRLTPPELAGFMRPLLVAHLRQRSGLSANPVGLCLVTMNGAPKGAYIVQEDRGRKLPRWGDDSVLLAELSSLPMVRKQVLALYDELVATYLSALLHDTGSPLSAREIRDQLQQDRRLLSESVTEELTDKQAVTALAKLLNEAEVLSANPAALYVVSDLALPSFESLAAETKWSSSRPDIISAVGEVVRPEGHAPVSVKLTASISRGESVATKALWFRVMPLEPKLPAVMMRVADRIRNEVRQDCIIDLWEDGEQVVDAQPARIKLRGNNALVLPKKSYSVKTEGAQPFHMPNGSRYLYLSAGYNDRTMLRVRLCHDIYRSLADAGEERFAPYVHHAELFINGHYDGIYEMITKVDRHLLGMPKYDQRSHRPDVLYKAKKAGANFKSCDPSQCQQDEPPQDQCVCWEPYEEFMSFVVSANPEKFARDVARYVDVDAMQDFHIFINTVASWDAYHHNFYLARKTHPDSGFFIVPWDCDSTFGRKADCWLSNHLLDRLMSDVPGYREELVERWRSLRKTVLSEETLLKRVDDLQEELVDYAAWDSQRWPDRKGT